MLVPDIGNELSSHRAEMLRAEAARGARGRRARPRRHASRLRVALGARLVQVGERLIGGAVEAG